MTQSPERPVKPAPTQPRDAEQARLHPRNRHQGRYDFARLTAQCPELSAFLTTTPVGDTTIDFSNPDAVRALNRALLNVDYGVAHWDIPDGYLCPPIPGRADYLHGLADLLAACNDGVIPRGPNIRVLDIGVGANCIYPLLGHSDYGWRFVGSDVDVTALQAARAIVQANPGLGDAIELRHQPNRGHIFAGVVRSDEQFDLSLCNPPFHASAEDAARGSQRKSRNLGTHVLGKADARLNFGGQPTELWCTGGSACPLHHEVPRVALWQPRSLIRNRQPLVAVVAVGDTGQGMLAKADRRDFIDRVVEDECRLASVDNPVQLPPAPDALATTEVTGKGRHDRVDAIAHRAAGKDRHRAVVVDSAECFRVVVPEGLHVGSLRFLELSCAPRGFPGKRRCCGKQRDHRHGQQRQRAD